MYSQRDREEERGELNFDYRERYNQVNAKLLKSTLGLGGCLGTRPANTSFVLRQGPSLVAWFGRKVLGHRAR